MVRGQWVGDDPFPLTLALSLGEREEYMTGDRIQIFGKSASHPSGTPTNCRLVA
jgi:hypothetical protein